MRKKFYCYDVQELQEVASSCNIKCTIHVGLNSTCFFTLVPLDEDSLLVLTLMGYTDKMDFASEPSNLNDFHNFMNSNHPYIIKDDYGFFTSHDLNK